MQVAGIIAEYNPFHNGHKYQLEQIKKRTGADYIIIAMSGNFLQRGTPALVDKYTRAKMALLQGADLILEIPTIWATASAEYYAHAGVHLLADTGVVTHLGFGAETNNHALLENIALFLVQEDSCYQKCLQTYLKQGLTFPEARTHSLRDSLSLSESEISLLSQPNNILALEYYKALHTQNAAITPCLIQRKGDSYHATDIHSAFASASAIRQMLSADANDTNTDILKKVLPDSSYECLKEYQQTYGYLFEDTISSMLGYQLHSCAASHFDSFADCSLELSHRIENHLPKYENFSQFCDLLKTRELTHTRISRVLIHIFLQITTQHYRLGKELDYIPYLRVLGFRKSASSLLHEIKKISDVPLITKPADAHKYIADNAQWMFEKDIFASNIYNQLILTNKKTVPKNDYSRELILL